MNVVRCGVEERHGTKWREGEEERGELGREVENEGQKEMDKEEDLLYDWKVEGGGAKMMNA